jgi:hypothetical protein
MRHAKDDSQQNQKVLLGRGSLAIRDGMKVSLEGWFS